MSEARAFISAAVEGTVDEAVARLRRAGAVFLGKTVLTDAKNKQIYPVFTVSQLISLRTRLA